MERVEELSVDVGALSAGLDNIEPVANAAAQTTETTPVQEAESASPVLRPLGQVAAMCVGCPFFERCAPGDCGQASKEIPATPSPRDQLLALQRPTEELVEPNVTTSKPVVSSKPKQPRLQEERAGETLKAKAPSFREQLMDDTVPAVFVKVEQPSVVPQNTIEEVPSAPPTEQPVSQEISRTPPSEHREPKKQPLVVDQELPTPPHATVTPEKPPKDTAPVPAAKSEQVTPEKSPTIRTEPEVSVEIPVRSVRETAEHQAITTPAPGDVVRPVATVPERPMSVEGGEIADEKPAPITELPQSSPDQAPISVISRAEEMPIAKEEIRIIDTVQRESVLQIPHEPDVQQAPDDVVFESSFPALSDETIIQPEEPTIYHMKKEAQPVVESDEQPEVIVIKNEETLVAHEAPVIKMSDEPKEFVPPAETVSEITNASMDADKIVPSPEPSASEETMVWRPDIVHTVVRDEQKDPSRDPIEENSAPQPTEQIAVRQSERVIEDVGAPHQKKVTIPHDAPEVTIDETMEMSDVLTPLFDLNSTPAPTITTQPAGLRAVLAALGFATLVVLRLRSA